MNDHLLQLRLRRRSCDGLDGGKCGLPRMFFNAKEDLDTLSKQPTEATNDDTAHQLQFDADADGDPAKDGSGTLLLAQARRLSSIGCHSVAGATCAVLAQCCVKLPVREISTSPAFGSAHGWQSGSWWPRNTPAPSPTPRCDAWQYVTRSPLSGLMRRMVAPDR